MIADPDRLSIQVTVDDSAVAAGVSVSLGLIVTELVINALKHAFPDDRQGRISVDYGSSAGEWALAVTDDGVGMPKGSEAPKAGLGTGIVKALARNLKGDIQVNDTGPGTAVTISHKDSACADDTSPAV